jgi:hypothetical protein
MTDYASPSKDAYEPPKLFSVPPANSSTPKGHGALNVMYDAIQKAQEVNNFTVDLLIICGDFQAVRNLTDLQMMSCPAKYRELGDFHEYYSGKRTAPILTLFIGGNHEASSHNAELYSATSLYQNTATLLGLDLKCVP